MRRAILGLSVAIILTSVSAVAAQESIRHPVVDSVASGLVGEHAPGLAVLVVRDGEVLHRATYGVVEAGTNRAVTARTPFYLASTAKMFTAAAVLDLVEEGRIGLDDPIGRHMDGVPAFARDVTVEQLLTHSAGLPDHYEIGGDERSYSNADVLEMLGRAGALSFEPGSRASYSNSGYVLLALMVESLTGRSFARVLEERFFGPLGMDDAFVAVGGDPRAHRAIGHRRVAGGFEPWDYASSTIGAGGVYASLADLERWFGGLADHRVLDSGTLHRASRPPTLSSERPTPYGMGWLAEFAARGPLMDRWYVLAFGSLRGFRSAFQWYQEDELLVVWMANGDADAAVDAFHPVPELLLEPAGFSPLPPVR